MLVAGEGHGLQAGLVVGGRGRRWVGAHVAGGELVVRVCGVQGVAGTVWHGELERGDVVGVVVVQRWDVLGGLLAL